MAYIRSDERQIAFKNADALAKALRREAKAYEFDGALYVIATGANAYDFAYTPDDALRRAKATDDASVQPVTNNLALTVACFMKSGRCLANAKGDALLAQPQIELLSLARDETKRLVGA